MISKKILVSISIIAIAAIASFNVNISSQENGLSDISLENVEALAFETTDPLPPSDGLSAMPYDCFDKYGQKVGSGTTCYAPGYSKSCTSKGC
ncbi:MAG: hypothetical protein LBV74_14115 [Tannerella sp.]|jgi:hypothetical protein|nr:hypothetical protein [Tannerella sp.]